MRFIIPQLLAASSLCCSIAATAQKTERDTLWIGANNRVLSSGEQADRYILKDTFINGHYEMKGFYTNGKPYKDGYAERKKEKGDGRNAYVNGKITWYKKDGSISTVQEFRADSSWAKNGNGQLIYLITGRYTTDFYRNGQPARRYHLGIDSVLRSGAYLENVPQKKQLAKPDAELFYDNGNRALLIDMARKTYVSWYENGVKAMELVRQPQGFLLKKYYRNGQPVSEEMLDEKLRANGAYSYFYMNGVLREKGSYEKNPSTVYEAPVYKYYPNGKLHSITEVQRRGQVMEVVVDVSNSRPASPTPPAEEKKSPNPDKYTYFDINGRQTFKYTENDKRPEGVFGYFDAQVGTLLPEQLTAEEKKYPELKKEELEREHGMNEFDTRYKLNGVLLNGLYKENTGREIRIYSFSNGLPAAKKTYIGFDDDLGFFRREASFPGLHFSRSLLLQGSYWDEDERLQTEVNNVTGLTRKQGFLYTMEQQGSGNRATITWQFVPQLTLALANPAYFLHGLIPPSWKQEFTEYSELAYEQAKQLTEEYVKRLKDREHQYRGW